MSRKILRQETEKGNLMDYHRPNPRTRFFGPKAITKFVPFANYSQNRGIFFVVSYLHRFTGVLLVIFLGFHIVTLSSLTTPTVYAEKMKLYQLPVLVVLEWALVWPVIFHALNGGRLILYESFRCRNDDLLLKWVAVLTLLYAAVVTLLMMMGNQSVSAVFYWLTALPTALVVVYALYYRLHSTSHARSWKLQRITGAFLLIMVPAHFLFMHLNPQVAKDVDFVTLRMENPWIKLVDTSLLVSAVYHSAYGLVSLINDYTGSKAFRWAGMAAVIVCMSVATMIGLKLIITI